MTYNMKNEVTVNEFHIWHGDSWQVLFE